MTPARPTFAARRTTVAVRLLVLVALVAGAIFGYRRLHPRERSIAVRGGKDLHVLLAKPEPHYLQHDARWAGDTLGSTRETLGAVGCLVCSLAMGSEALGAAVDPGELNRRLGASQGYTSEARVIWAKVPVATGGAVEVTVLAQPEHAAVDAALERGELAVVRFTLPSGAPHWVLVVGKDADEYLVKDPLTDEPIVKLTSRTAWAMALQILRLTAVLLLSACSRRKATIAEETGAARVAALPCTPPADDGSALDSLSWSMSWPEAVEALARGGLCVVEEEGYKAPRTWFTAKASRWEAVVYFDQATPVERSRWSRMNPSASTHWRPAEPREPAERSGAVCGAVR